MVFRRGRDLYGPGFWKWGAYGSTYGGVRGGAFAGGMRGMSLRGRGRGMGNPYPFCRCFPWLPRGWWAAPWGQGLRQIETMSGEDEIGMLKEQEAMLSARLQQIRSLVSGREVNPNENSRFVNRAGS